MASFSIDIAPGTHVHLNVTTAPDGWLRVHVGPPVPFAPVDAPAAVAAPASAPQHDVSALLLQWAASDPHAAIDAVQAVGWKTVDDIDAASLEKHIQHIGAKVHHANDILNQCAAFVDWLVAHNHMAKSPFRVNGHLVAHFQRTDALETLMAEWFASPEHTANITRSELRRVRTFNRWEWPEQITARGVRDAAQYITGKVEDRAKNQRERDRITDAIYSFCGWLVRQNHLDTNPLPATMHEAAVLPSPSQPAEIAALNGHAGGI